MRFFSILHDLHRHDCPNISRISKHVPNNTFCLYFGANVMSRHAILFHLCYTMLSKISGFINESPNLFYFARQAHIILSYWENFYYLLHLLNHSSFVWFLLYKKTDGIKIPSVFSISIIGYRYRSYPSSLWLLSSEPIHARSRLRTSL